MFDRLPAAGFLACGVLLLCSACAVPPRPAGQPAAGETGPGITGRLVAAFRVVESDLAVRVYRDGPLAQLGHNHVVSSTGVTGAVELRDPLEASTFRLSLPLDSLVVDDPVRRAAAGPDFPDELTDTDREGTRRNLLGPALFDAVRFPVLHVDSVGIQTDGHGYAADVRVDAAGIERVIRMPVTIEWDGGDLVASGTLALTHAEIGLVPYSAALGALRVRDEMEVAYRLVARRVDP